VWSAVYGQEQRVPDRFVGVRRRGEEEIWVELWVGGSACS